MSKLMGIIFLAFGIGCGTTNDRSNPLRPVPTASGMYIHPETKQPFDGVYDVIEDGVRLKMEIKNGWPHGLWQRWYSSGQIHEEYNLIQKKRNGLQRSWYPNGNLRVELFFKNGRLLSGKTWKISGTLASTVKNGTGTLILYDSRGQNRRESEYRNGAKQ